MKFKPGLLDQATPDGGVSPCLDAGEKYLIRDAGQESPAFHLEVVHAARRQGVDLGGERGLGGHGAHGHAIP